MAFSTIKSPRTWMEISQIIWFTSRNSGVSSVLSCARLLSISWYVPLHILCLSQNCWISSKNDTKSGPEIQFLWIYPEILHLWCPPMGATAPHFSPRLVQIRHIVPRSATGGAAAGIPHGRRIDTGDVLRDWREDVIIKWSSNPYDHQIIKSYSLHFIYRHI